MRHKRPDKKNAISLLEAARKTIDYTLTLELNESSASTIIRNIYECFRMLGDAILIGKGIMPDDHLLPIKEISSLEINSKRPIALVENLRILRHNINYYGYDPSTEEAKDAISIAQNCFYEAYGKIKTELTRT